MNKSYFYYNIRLRSEKEIVFAKGIIGGIVGILVSAGIMLWIYFSLTGGKSHD